MDTANSKLIVEIITPIFTDVPVLKKIPGCPDGFIWRDTEYKIQRKLSEWHDYKRRGRMARNMRPAHAASAEEKGSWGVGIDFFLIETVDNRIFLISFDRAPKSSDVRKGDWLLEREYFSLSGLEINGE